MLVSAIELCESGGDDILTLKNVSLYRLASLHIDACGYILSALFYAIHNL